VRGMWAVVIAGVAGVLVSGTMEVVQNYLPSRVASNLDLSLPTARGFAGERR